jgi:hypothetical protein
MKTAAASLRLFLRVHHEQVGEWLQSGFLGGLGFGGLIGLAVGGQ